MSRLRLGVDLGGSKIEIVALGDAGQQLLRRRIATPQGDWVSDFAGGQGAVRQLCDLLLMASGQYRRLLEQYLP